MVDSAVMLRRAMTEQSEPRDQSPRPASVTVVQLDPLTDPSGARRCREPRLLPRLSRLAPLWGLSGSCTRPSHHHSFDSVRVRQCCAGRSSSSSPTPQPHASSSGSGCERRKRAAGTGERQRLGEGSTVAGLPPPLPATCRLPLALTTAALPSAPQQQKAPVMASAEVKEKRKMTWAQITKSLCAGGIAGAV